MSNIPKLSWDLIDILDKQEVEPKFPTTRTAAVNLDESQIRLGLWHAARRALVNELLTLRQEDEDDAEGNHTSTSDQPSSILSTPVLDPNGEARVGVASVYLAPTGPSAD